MCYVSVYISAVHPTNKELKRKSYLMISYSYLFARIYFKELAICWGILYSGKMKRNMQSFLESLVKFLIHIMPAAELVRARAASRAIEAAREREREREKGRAKPMAFNSDRGRGGRGGRGSRGGGRGSRGGSRNGTW